MMKLLIFGATGRIGLLTARIALERGHDITLYVRDESKVPTDLKNDTRVKIISGTLTSTTSLSTAIFSQDAILSALGPSLNPFHSAPGALSTGYKNILSQMQTHNVPLIYALSTPDIYHHEDKPSLKRTLAYYLVKLVAWAAQKECIEIGKVFQEGDDEDSSGQDGSGSGPGPAWVVYRVGMLTDGDADGKVNGPVCAGVVGEDGFALEVKRRDCARWLVEEVEKGLESPWIRRMPVLWSSTGKEKVT